jgi:8-oxo-dGTP pyrophosphatase MutT (NUDIX family)
MGNKIKRAGLIPFYKDDDDQIYMMFMMPSDEKYGGMVFQIAKGRIDEGENPLQAAVREAVEELGVRENNIKWIQKCGVFLNTHHIYIAEMDTMDLSKYNKPCFETSEVKWLTPDEFFKIGRRLHFSIADKCIRLFKQRLSGK